MCCNKAILSLLLLQGGETADLTCPRKVDSRWLCARRDVMFHISISHRIPPILSYPVPATSYLPTNLFHT